MRGHREGSGMMRHIPMPPADGADKMRRDKTPRLRGEDW